LGGDRAATEGYRRFLHNEAVTLDLMVAHAAGHTAAAARGREHVLAIQDTTELNFSKHRGSKRGFGVVGNGRDLGLFLHPVIVVDAGNGDPNQVGHAGGILGLAGARFYSREVTKPSPAKPKRKKSKADKAKSKKPKNKKKRCKAQIKKTEQARLRRARSIMDKETGRWIKGQEAAEQVLAGARMVTEISDREADIYEKFAKPRPENYQLLTRAAHDRCLGDGGKLFKTLASLPGYIGPTIDIPAKPGQPARSARTRVSWHEIEILRGRSSFGIDGLPPSIKLRAVRVEELDPPEGVEPVVWMLLTTHEVGDLAQAVRIVNWYRARWTIEQLFRTLKKQGFQIEKSQIQTPEAMKKLAFAVLIAALFVLQLVYARSGITGQALADAIDPADEPLVEELTARLEGKTARLKNPHRPGTLARLSWVVARLGGWNGYVGHGYKPAGPTVMARGLKEFESHCRISAFYRDV